MSRNYHLITSTYPIESYLNETVTTQSPKIASKFTQRQLNNSQTKTNFHQVYEVAFN